MKKTEKTDGAAAKAIRGSERSSRKNTLSSIRNKTASRSVKEPDDYDGFIVPNSRLGEVLGIPQAEVMDRLVKCGILEAGIADGREILEIAARLKDLNLASLKLDLMKFLEFKEHLEICWSRRGVNVISRFFAELKLKELRSISGLILRGIVSEADRTTVVVKTGRALA